MRPKLLGFVAVGILLIAAPASAGTRGATAPLPPLSPASPTSAEGRLRAAETAALGADHAAAHAYQRELAARARHGLMASEAKRAKARRGVTARAVPNNLGGAWSAARPLPVIAINAIMLPTGKVLMFAYPRRPTSASDPAYQDFAKAYVWNPVTGDSTAVPPPIDPDTGNPTNIFCSGASLLADGRVLITGGNVGNPFDTFHGLNTAFIFNPFTETWERQPSMRQGRWYPTQLRMPDGRTLIVAGLTRPGDPDFASGLTNNDLEIFSPDGSLERNGMRFNGASTPPMTGLYPRMFWMPSGRAMAAGPFATDTWFLRPKPAGTTWTWNAASDELPDMSRDREWGTAVQLSGGRIMTFGGSPTDIDPGPASVRPATNTTEVFDEDTPAAGWTAGPNMAVARSHANSVILPDAEIATIGGGTGENGNYEYYRWLYTESNKQPGLYDPATGSTTLGNPQHEARTYHSTALLLPDGRVFSAGDDINGAGGPGTGLENDTAEIYSPPYLFKGPRPTLGSVPSWAGFGDTFEVSTSGAAVTKAVLIAPGAATHAADMNQRRVLLDAPVARPNGHVAVQMPSNPNLAPPGYYMLFLLSNEGVPSVARFVRIDASGHLPPPVPDPDPKPANLVLKVHGKLPRMRTLRRTKRFRLTIEISEPGKVRLSTLIERGKKPAKSVVKARTITFKAAGTRRVTLRLTRAGLRRIKAKRRAVLRIRAKAAFASGRTLPVVQVRRKLR
jgi:Domain of unknown function (DUF1929)